MSENTSTIPKKEEAFLFFHSSLWGHAPFMTLLCLTVGWLTVIAPIIWFVGFFLMKATSIRVEDNSLVYQGYQGFSSLQKEIQISDIKAIEVNYSLSQMLFGKRFGTIKIATSGTSGYEVIMYGVRQADELRKIWRTKKA